MVTRIDRVRGSALPTELSGWDISPINLQYFVLLFFSFIISPTANSAGSILENPGVGDWIAVIYNKKWFPGIYSYVKLK
jgi:hypothetical protein